MLLDSPAEILAKYLVAAGIGYEPGLTSTTTADPSANANWPIYISFAGDGDDMPDPMIVIYDYKGLIEGRLMLNGETIEHYGIHIRLRSLEYSEGFAKSLQIANLLDGIARPTVQLGSTIYRIDAVSRSSIIPLGTDPEAGRMIRTSGDRRRTQFAINAHLSLTKM